MSAVLGEQAPAHEGRKEKGRRRKERGRRKKECLSGKTKSGRRLLAPLLLLITLVVMDSNPPGGTFLQEEPECRHQLLQRQMARAAKGKERVVGVFLL